MSPDCATGIKLIAGLGNPGAEYRDTRHNAGFMLIDRLSRELPGAYGEKEKYKGVYREGRFKGRNLFLLKPMTFMNLSGEAVDALMKAKSIVPNELLLAYDDVDLPLGRIRLRRGGSSGGHKGVESVISETGSSGFARLRIGIGRDEGRNGQVDYVLSGFTEEERDMLDKVLDMALEAVKLALSRGISVAMNEFNGRDLAVMESEEENGEDRNE